MDCEKLISRLKKPQVTVDVVIDTDTFNEIDDQFALAYLIRSDDKLNLKAILAAPFLNDKSSSPSDGMAKSYQEIKKILTLMKREDLYSKVHRGSECFLINETEPVQSPAANELVKLASGYSKENPLYVVAIGAITNVASALLIEPSIKDRIVVVWLGGNAYDWPHTHEFNMYQDVAAARVVFGCGVALVQLPCMGVVSAFSTSGPELIHWLKGKNELCDYLLDATFKDIAEDAAQCWTRSIWDVTAVAWLLNGDFMLDRLEYCPIPQYDNHYSFDKNRHFIRYVYHINRDKLFEDLFTKLQRADTYGS